MTADPGSTLPAPMDSQMVRASRLRRLRDRLAAVGYRSAATSGAISGAGFGLLMGIATWIDAWLPRLQPRATSTNPRGVLLACIIFAIGGALLALAATAVLRGWTRWRLVRLRRPAD